MITFLNFCKLHHSLFLSECAHVHVRRDKISNTYSHCVCEDVIIDRSLILSTEIYTANEKQKTRQQCRLFVVVLVLVRLSVESLKILVPDVTFIHPKFVKTV